VAEGRLAEAADAMAQYLRGSGFVGSGMGGYGDVQMKKPMTKQAFTKAVNKIIEESKYGGLNPDFDPESFHGDTDDLMEELLISLGYRKGVELIRNKTRWYG